MALEHLDLKGKKGKLGFPTPGSCPGPCSDLPLFLTLTRPPPWPPVCLSQSVPPHGPRGVVLHPELTHCFPAPVLSSPTPMAPTPTPSPGSSRRAEHPRDGRGRVPWPPWNPPPPAAPGPSPPALRTPLAHPLPGVGCPPSPPPPAQAPGGGRQQEGHGQQQQQQEQQKRGLRGRQGCGSQGPRTPRGQQSGGVCQERGQVTEKKGQAREGKKRPAWCWLCDLRTSLGLSRLIHKVGIIIIQNS